MSSYVLFLLLGLGSGAVYGILALGLVLKQRAAGVIDFGHGAVAMFVAYVYLGLRNEGTLQFPWVVIPHEISFGSDPFDVALWVSAELPVEALASAIDRRCASLQERRDRFRLAIWSAQRLPVPRSAFHAG